MIRLRRTRYNSAAFDVYCNDTIAAAALWYTGNGKAAEIMRRRPFKSFGLLIAAAGLLLVLAIILPSELWWFFLGLGMICAGILICRH